MARFFLHIDQPRPIRDLTGMELEGLQAAKCEVIRKIADVLCADPREFWDESTHAVRVANADDLTLFMVEVTTTKAPALG